MTASPEAPAAAADGSTDIGARPATPAPSAWTARWRVPLALLSGLLLALSFPKFGHGAVAFVALAPLLVALPSLPGRKAFLLGHLSGFVAALGLLYWTALVVVQFGGLPWPLALLGLGLLCAAYALFNGVFAWIVAAWTRRHGLAALLLAPLAWVAMETLRAYTFFRFPWCLLGYSQQEHLPLIQVASLTAVYGVSFVLVASSSALAYALVEPRPARRRAALAGLSGLLAVVLGYGYWRLSSAPEGVASLRVGLVQASIPQDEKWDVEHLLGNVRQHVRLTEAAAAQGARLVVWPESAVPWSYDHTPAMARELDELARRLDVDLMFGNDDRDHDAGGQPRFYVAAKMLDPNGQLSLRYRKMRLVPFGEYTPLEPLFTLGGRVTARLVAQVGGFTPGSDYARGPVPGGSAAALICYEAIFPDLVREFTARGATLLVSLTNDAWYGRSSAPYQHFAMTAFRAVENDVHVVRAANTGISAVVDPRGRVLARTELFDRTALVHDVKLPAETGAPRTFYARYGDVFAFGCLGATLLFSVRVW